MSCSVLCVVYCVLCAVCLRVLLVVCYVLCGVYFVSIDVSRCSLCGAKCFLFVACCCYSLRVVRRLRLAAFCMISSVVCWLLHVACFCWLLVVGCCLFLVVRGLLLIGCCLSFV